jgi:hypothetical protein
LNCLNSCNVNILQTRAAVPEANEALSPQEAAAGPMEVQAKETFSKQKIAAPGASATDCMTGITPAENSFKAKKQNAEHVRGAARKSKGNVADMHDISVTMKHMVYGWIIL